MDRTKFYNVVTIDGIEELDYLHNNLSKFTTFYPVSYYIVKEVDLVRPDLISYRLYGDVGYWWLLMKLNGIEDIFNDLEVGKVLKIPNLLDIYTFYKKYRMR